MPNSPFNMSDEELSDDNFPREKSELELLREKNIRERDAYLASLMSDPEFAEVMGTIDFLNTKAERTPKVKKQDGSVDPTVRFKISIPLERRRSARLENKPPIFTGDDLADEKYKAIYKEKRYDDNDYNDLEEVVYQPRKFRTVVKRNAEYKPAIPVEHVTESMIKNIAKKVSLKVHSGVGTSCHQCRQKTIDQKTCCRSTSCVGIRGQFCGVCLENRYGEQAAVALKDPNWHCPVCRGICNCSFCRAKVGKRPTGILTPQALQAGHKSVKDFLESLKGVGDYPHLDNLYQKQKDPKCLLGFSKDLTTAYMGGDTEYKMNINMTLDKLKVLCQKEEEKLNVFKVKQQKDAYHLLGFKTFSGNTPSNNNIQCKLQAPFSLEHFENFMELKHDELELMEKKQED